MNSPLESAILFQIGPVPITQAVVTTWVIMLVLVLGAYFLTRRIGTVPGKRQAALELVVATLDTQIRETTGAAPGPYRSFIGTLFLFILVANWSSLVPGIDPPTAQLETDAALAVLVFLSVIWFGVRSGGSWRLHQILRRAQSGDDPAQHARKPHPCLFHVRSPVRQCDERGFRHRNCRLSGRASCAHSTNGARPADRACAGLHLCRSGDGFHCGCGRRRQASDHNRDHPVPLSEPRG
jgi:hypothetical protein